MHRLLAHIRRQPRSVRDKYAFYGAAAFTALVALFWVGQMVNSFNIEGENQMVASTAEQDIVVTSKPFGSVFRFIGNAFGGDSSRTGGLEIVLPELNTSSSDTDNVIDDGEEGSLQGGGTDSYNWFNQ